jgi:hypothetical protein
MKKVCHTQLRPNSSPSGSNFYPLPKTFALSLPTSSYPYQELRIYRSPFSRPRTGGQKRGMQSSLIYAEYILFQSKKYQVGLAKGNKTTEQEYCC